MRLFELFVTERIYISNAEHNALTNIFSKWAKSLAVKYADVVDSYQQLGFELDSDYDDIIVGLKRSLLPSIRSIIKQHIPDIETVKQNMQANKIRGINDRDNIDNFIGHMLTIDIDKFGDSTQGHVFSKWEKTYVGKNADRTFKLQNSMYIAITIPDIIQAIHDPSKVEGWVSTVTHEITHLMQSLRSSTQRIHNKVLHPEGSDREQYLSSTHEIESYAQSVTTAVISDGQRKGDPVKAIDTAIQGIKMGMQTVFKMDLFKGQDYTEYRDFFRTPAKTLEQARAKQKVWRTFQKALIAKLLNAREQFSK